MANARFERGRKLLAKMHGKRGTQVLEELEKTVPDLGKFIVEFPYGDIYARPGLNPKMRHIATLASLITQGNYTLELKVHLHAGMNLGLTKKEIGELILQMAVYAGFPAAVNAALVFKEVLAERK